MTDIKILDIVTKTHDIVTIIRDIDIKSPDIDARIPDINIKISDIDIKIHDIAADHQSKNPGKLSRTLKLNFSHSQQLVLTAKFSQG